MRARLDELEAAVAALLDEGDEPEEESTDGA